MFTIFVDTEKQILELIQFFVSTPISIFSGGVSILAASFVSVWFTYRVILILSGVVGDPVMPLLKDFFIKIIIILLVVGHGNYVAMVSNTLDETNRGIVKDVLRENFSIFSKLDSSFNELSLSFEILQNAKKDKQNNVELVKQHGEKSAFRFVAIAMAYVDDAVTNASNTVDIKNNIFEPIINFIKLTVIAIGFFVLSLSVFITVMMNQIFFKLCLGVGPLFVFFAAFEKLRGWSSSWLNMTLGYCFSYPLIAITVSALMDIFNKILQSNENQGYVTWASVFKVFILCYVFAIIIQRVGDIASGLFGAGNIADGTSAALAAMGYKTGQLAGSTVAGSATKAMNVGKRAGKHMIDGFLKRTSIENG